MSGQENDIFIYGNTEYSISAIEFTDAFIDIYSLGIKPTPFSTACRRGYVATYAIKEEKLILKKLYTNSGNKNEASIINNKLPIITILEGLPEIYKFTYENIELIINYTGSILITTGLIRERYVHMGFQSPISYKTIIQLTFNDGKLISTKDFSDIAESIRKAETKLPKKNKMDITQQWVNDCFDLSYNKKANELINYKIGGDPKRMKRKKDK
jgi:hypothetical protein